MPRRVKQIAILPRRVRWPELGADGKHKVRAANRGIGRRSAEGPENTQCETMDFGKHPLAGSGCHDRHAGSLGQRGQPVIGLGDANAVAGDDHRQHGGKQRPAAAATCAVSAGGGAGGR